MDTRWQPTETNMRDFGQLAAIDLKYDTWPKNKHIRKSENRGFDIPAPGRRCLY